MSCGSARNACELATSTAFVRARPDEKKHELPAVIRLKYRGLRLERRRERDVITIGRDPKCDLVVEDKEASREHCVIERRKDKWVLKDVSSNGTYVTIDGDQEMRLQREELTLLKRGWITLGEPRVHAAEVVEFFLGPAPAKPQQPEK